MSENEDKGVAAAALLMLALVGIALIWNRHALNSSQRDDWSRCTGGVLIGCIREKGAE